MRIPRLHERALHSFRRKSALRRLAEQVPPGPVLMICHGNICRSPFAEAVFVKYLPDAYVALYPVHSAGFIGPNRHSPPQALAAAERAGLDLTGHRSKLFTGEMIREASLVVVMSGDQERGLRARFPENASKLLVLGDLDPLAIDARTIQDPWNHDDSVFDDSYARIDRCIRELVRALISSRAVDQTALRV